MVIRHSLATAAFCATSFSRLPFLAECAVLSAKTVNPEAVGECGSSSVNSVVFARVDLLPALGIFRCSLTMIEGTLWESQRRRASGGLLFDCSRPGVVLVRGPFEGRFSPLRRSKSGTHPFQSMLCPVSLLVAWYASQLRPPLFAIPCPTLTTLFSLVVISSPPGTVLERSDW